MLWRITLVLVCFGVANGGVACAPPGLGSTVVSGYTFSVQVSNDIVWLGPVEESMAARFPKAAAIIVTVRDPQGRPVDDVPVRFALEPDWVGSASLEPSEARTRGGRARSLFFDPRTTGVVRILVRVDGPTAQVQLTPVQLTVESYEEPTRKE
jgi:hypothetical protein